MSSISEKSCKSCSKTVKVHVRCFKCNTVYHVQCLLKVPSVFVNDEGNIFCCSNRTSGCSELTSKAIGNAVSIIAKSAKKYLQSEGPETPNRDALDDLGVKEENVDDCVIQISEELSAYYDVRNAKNLKGDVSKFPEPEVERDMKNGVTELSENAELFACNGYKEQVLNRKNDVSHVQKCNRECLLLDKQQSTADSNAEKCKCNKCSLSTEYNFELHIHNNERQFDIHDTERDKKFKCLYCNNSYHSHGGLIYHVNSKHLNDRKFKCNICSYAAFHSSGLRSHTLLRHSDEGKRYKCDHCNYSTRVKGSLLKHILIHTNEKPFACSHQGCSYKCKHSWLLKKHILVKHGDVARKYKCAYCDYSSYEKGNLKTHTRIHTNEKPFKCPHEKCDYKSVRKCQLVEHIKRKHRLYQKKP